MLFNTLNFALFLPIVFLLYWGLKSKSHRAQNVLLLVASYYFYSCWNWKFTFVLLFTTGLDYLIAIKMKGEPHRLRKKIWLWTSILVSISILATFKYFYLFAGPPSELTSKIGLHENSWALDILIPVGISFYTFHGLSYVIDVYYGRISTENNFVDYAVFVSFFPLLVAGPIERATHLLPQLKKKRVFDSTAAVDGLKQILWGLFKKVVVADNCAYFVDRVFSDPSQYNGSTLILGAIFFSIQIYGDFSGYSDVAIGVARLFGINLIRNFSYPFFARNMAEFWQRWHISLSSWFRDYVYIPLGGSKGSLFQTIRNTFIVFILSAFWHGSKVTFIVWGLLYAFYMLPSIIRKFNRKNLLATTNKKPSPTLKDLASILATFSCVVFAGIFFRSENLPVAIEFIRGMLSTSVFSFPNLNNNLVLIASFSSLLMIVEWIGQDQQYAIANFGKNWPVPLRWALYYGIVAIIFVFANINQSFIYFQF